MVSVGDERCFPLDSHFDPHQIVRAVEVQLGKDVGSSQLFQGGREEGKWIPELDSHTDQGSVINARP